MTKEEIGMDIGVEKRTTKGDIEKVHKGVEKGTELFGTLSDGRYSPIP